MTERKIAGEILDTGFGFPVRLLNVPLVKLRASWVPDIDYDALARVVLRALSEKPARLTGHEVRFIRLHHRMSLKRFADTFGVQHQAVMKWEAAGSDATKMTWGTEKDLRLWLFLQIQGSSADAELATLYRALDPQIAKRRESLAAVHAVSYKNRRPSVVPLLSKA